MKLLYETPELEVLKLRLSKDVLGPSIESGQGSSAGGTIGDNDNPGPDLDSLDG